MVSAWNLCGRERKEPVNRTQEALARKKSTKTFNLTENQRFCLSHGSMREEKAGQEGLKVIRKRSHDQGLISHSGHAKPLKKPVRKKKNRASQGDSPMVRELG